MRHLFGLLDLIPSPLLLRNYFYYCTYGNMGREGGTLKAIQNTQVL